MPCIQSAVRRLFEYLQYKKKFEYVNYLKQYQQYSKFRANGLWRPLKGIEEYACFYASTKTCDNMKTSRRICSDCTQDDTSQAVGQIYIEKWG